MNAEETSILVVEDERDLRQGLRHNLELDGYQVDVAATGTEGLRKALTGTHGLIILDLMLPELDGLDVLRELRNQRVATPVIILSAKGRDQDKVSGLELGADDYVSKPFGLAELMARVRAVLRRTSAKDLRGETVYEFPNLTVDFKRFTVTRGGEEHQLSRYEAEILRMLIAHAGEVVTRSDLLRTVWGYVHLPTTRTVDNHIARLRKKIEATADDPQRVITVHGIGYRFEPGGRPA
jgi:DNA-binding response OmpR family regulator